MATVDLRTESIHILSGLSEESLPIAFGLLTALKNQKLLRRVDLVSVYPWARHLSDEEQNDFFSELSDATKLARTSGDFSAVDETIDAWRETAEILGDAETMTDIANAEAEIEKGEVASWDAVKQRLGINS